MTPRALCISLTLLLALAAPASAQEPRLRPVTIAPAPTTAAPAPVAPVPAKTEAAPVAPLSKTTAPVTSFAPVQKGATATPVPACWQDVATTEAKLRQRASELAAALGGDASDRASAAGSMQAHARRAALYASAHLLFRSFVFGPWVSISFLPSYYGFDCDSEPSTPPCVRLQRSLDEMDGFFKEGIASVIADASIAKSRAADLVASGGTPQIRSAAAALKTEAVALGDAMHRCSNEFDRLPRSPSDIAKKPLAPVPVASLPLAALRDQTLMFHDAQIQAKAKALVGANAAIAFIIGQEIALGAKTSTWLRGNAVAVLGMADNLPPPPTAPSSPTPGALPDPVADAGSVFTHGRLSGDFEIKIGKKVFRLENVYLAARSDGRIDIYAGDLPLGGCTHTVRTGSRLESGKLVVNGTLRCGSLLSRKSTVTLGDGKIEASVEVDLYGHVYKIDLKWSKGELRGEQSWQGSSTDWQKVRGLDLEYRAEGPTLKLVVRGTNTTVTFDANKLELRSASKKPDGTPWAYASIDPPAKTVSNGKLELPLPTLPAPGDVLKASRDLCIEAATKGNPPGRPRDTAISACNGSFPSPPAIPTPPKSISVEVKVVIK